MTTLAGDPVDAWPVQEWYDDLCGCLQIDVGHVLERYGWDPVQALGAGWRFLAPTGTVEPVEYFHPAGERLGDAFCRYHPVTLRWHRPRDAAEAHDGVLAALANGTPSIVAVNNFHLPFRPAYQDVHAAHLVIVTGFAPERDVYRVVDPIPPSFSGDVPRPVLATARERLSVGDPADPFFAGAGPARRWLEVRATGPQPVLTWPWLREVIRENTAILRTPGEGLPALDDLLRELPGRIAAEGARPLREIYVLGWPAQAEAALHSDFLARAARTLDRPDVAEAGRWADLVASAWTGVRVAAAHAATCAEHGTERIADSAVTRVMDLGRHLLLTWERCVQRMERLTGERP